MTDLAAFPTRPRITPPPPVVIALGQASALSNDRPPGAYSSLSTTTPAPKEGFGDGAIKCPSKLPNHHPLDICKSLDQSPLKEPTIEHSREQKKKRAPAPNPLHSSAMDQTEPSPNPSPGPPPPSASATPPVAAIATPPANTPPNKPGHVHAHRQSFAENQRHPPPSPRAQRHLSFTQQAIQDLLINPPSNHHANPRYAGRDWRDIALGELAPYEAKWADLDTTVEEATMVRPLSTHCLEPMR